MTEFFLDLGYWSWFIIAAVLFILEAFIPGLFLVWLGAAAAVAGVAALAFGLAFPWQLLVFAVASVVAVVATRRFYSQTGAANDGSTLNVRAQQYVGRTFVLAESIQNGRRRMKVGDTLWTVEGPDMASGSNVKVTGSKGNVLLVEAADNGDAPDLPKAGSFS